MPANLIRGHIMPVSLEYAGNVRPVPALIDHLVVVGAVFRVK
jgi:hypothetical protein